MSGVQTAYDTALGTAAVSSPWWIKLIEDGISGYVLVVGAILITLRAIKAYRDLKKDK